MSDNQIIQTVEEMWAIVELMGHGQTAGRIFPPGEYGNLYRVDVPTEAGFVTELYSEKAIYRIKFVSEQIARAYAPKEREITAYDAPIVSREAHETAIRQLRSERRGLMDRVVELERRLTAVNALPAGDEFAGFDENELPDF